jgi:solute carrier family 24 (sodium/potassium/calcium exchanger), member 6
MLGMSESLAGVTFLAFGNGSPDVFSTFAAMSTNSGSLAVGELIGAAGFITAVVAGSMALVRPFKVVKRSFIRDVSFFIVAAAFSLYFLHDGRLYMLECVAMVGFYVFYVIFVVTWHWWLSRRVRKQQTDATTRSHYTTLDGEVADVEPYHDEEDRQTGARRTPLRGPSVEDFLALEHDNERLNGDGLDEDDQEEARARLLATISSNMRLRPRPSERRLTQTAIRPSLLGALEFQGVLSSLNKARNIHAFNLRRYSDEVAIIPSQQQDSVSIISDSAIRSQRDAGLGPRADPHIGTRLRAVSANDADGLALDPGILQQHKNYASANLLGPWTAENANVKANDTRHSNVVPTSIPSGPSTNSSLIASHSPPNLRAQSPTKHGNSIVNHLTPLEPWHPEDGSRYVPSDPESQTDMDQNGAHSLGHISGRNLPKLAIPHSSNRPSADPTSPFPSLTSQPISPKAPSARLSQSSLSFESLIPPGPFMESSSSYSKAYWWWPYTFLPPPSTVLSTLFPTLCAWKEKALWEKALGIVAAPSVLLLTLTLPVVETDSEHSDEDNIPDLSLNSSISRNPGVQGGESGRRTTDTGPPTITIQSENRYYDDPDSLSVNVNSSRSSNAVSYAGAVNEVRGHNTILSPSGAHILESPEQLPTTPPSSGLKDWNRWLVIIQTFTSPLFIILMLWANMSPDSPRQLLRASLFALLGSLIFLFFLLLTTTSNRPPKWRFLLSFVGFCVSITWISSIANEVVGVLKTLGVILNISDAILGLTIFAVGNSMGDLVADITVARLGYPVMALSACFGGPMLNILLGIGLSGLYITFHGANERNKKHPDKPMKFKPFYVEVSRTLMISGATLLVTLVFILVAVWRRRWKMDRFIGITLITLWVVSTIGNVIGEILGWGKRPLTS